jgi:hypothetical protein
MRKKTRLLLTGFALLFVATVLVNPSILKSLGFGAAIPGAVSNDVWCSDWISLGCGERSENQTAYMSTAVNQWDSGVFTCNYMKGCEITGISNISTANCYGGINFKRNGQDFLTAFSGSVFCAGSSVPCIGKCNLSSADVNPYFVGMRLNSGETISYRCTPSWLLPNPASNVNFYFKGKFDRLVWCGQGPTAVSCDAATSGVPVLGADGCAFNIDKLKAEQPNLENLILNVQGEKVATKSYVVPEGQNIWVAYNGTRHVCGTLESECVTNEGCQHRYPLSFPIGSNLGNADVVGGRLIQYTCSETGAQTCSKWSGVVEGQGTCVEYTKKKQCSGGATGISAECVPYASTCGTNAFCDPNTLQCVSTGVVRCKSDKDPVCGMDTVCDRVSATLKEPYCRNPNTTSSGCDFRTIRNISCCSKSDCASNEYCNTNYQCVKEIPGKVECPYECCNDDERYFDKPLDIGTRVCCPNHTLKDNILQCEEWRCLSDADCKENERCDLATGRCVDARVCQDREGVFPFIVGWKSVQTDTPIYLIPFPWGGGLIETDRTTTTSCVEIWNLTVILIIVLGFALILFALYYRKGGRKGRKKGR